MDSQFFQRLTKSDWVHYNILKNVSHLEFQDFLFKEKVRNIILDYSYPTKDTCSIHALINKKDNLKMAGLNQLSFDFSTEQFQLFSDIMDSDYFYCVDFTEIFDIIDEII